MSALLTVDQIRQGVERKSFIDRWMRWFCICVVRHDDGVAVLLLQEKGRENVLDMG